MSTTKNSVKRRPSETAGSTNAPFDAQVPALQRGLAVLELLAATPAGLTLVEIHTALDLPAASAFRITAALEQLGYLARDPASKRFTLTRKLLLLGQPRGSGLTLIEASIDAMRRVRNETSETTQLCCLADHECVVLEQLASLHPFKYIVDLGSRPPAYCAAPGKAMLAFLPEKDRDAAIRKLDLKRHTARTLTSRAAFAAELEKIRVQGYAVDHGEHFEGIHCVAAPLLDHHGCQIAALTIAGPSERLPANRFHELGQLMIAAASDAARKFLG